MPNFNSCSRDSTPLLLSRVQPLQVEAGEEENYSKIKAFSNGTHWLGRKIFKYSGFSFCLEHFIKIFIRSVRPGKQDQSQTYRAEVTARVIFALPVTTFLIATLAFGILGFALQGIANKILIKCGHNFSFEKPRFITPPQNVKQLKICTLNAAMMPDFVAALNCVRPSSKRINELADQILEKDDDVICLQEMFAEETNYALVKKIKHQYPYILYNVAPNPTGLNSGLVIASKYPLKNPEFFRHGELGGACQYANKGVLAVTIDLGQDPNGNAKEAFIFTTHLNAEANENDPNENTPKGAYFRQKQLDQMESELVPNYVKEHSSTAKCVGIFRCGDYNISPREKAEVLKPSAEWDVLSPNIKRLREKNVDAELREHADGGRSMGTTFNVDSDFTSVVRPESGIVSDVSDINTGWDLNNIEDWTVIPERLDHILTQNPETAQAHVDRMQGVSDHLAVRAILDVETEVALDKYYQEIDQLNAHKEKRFQTNLSKLIRLPSLNRKDLSGG